MSSDTPYEVEGGSYGELLGEYFEVAAEISRLLDDFGRPRVEERAQYDELRERKRALREQLAEVEDDQSPGDIESILDRALSPE